MNQDRAEITVVTDISANIFAVFILIPVILIIARNQAPPPQAPMAPPTVDIEADLASIQRAPLTPAEMVQLLYERRADAPTVKIDLFDDRIEIPDGNAVRRLSLGATPAAASIPALPAGTPVGLYVFGHRGYRLVTEHLASTGRTWREISVPAALRQREAGSGREDWSTGFRDLLARRQDIAGFRTGLARLLASPGPGDGASAGRLNPAGGGGAAPPFRLPAGTLLERAAAWLRAALEVTACLAGFGFIAWVERASRRARAR